MEGRALYLNSLDKNDKSIQQIKEEFRGGGYGKRLLETAIYILNSVNEDKVTLTVIEKNSVALNI